MADEFSGFEAIGFDNLGDLPILMKALTEWSALCAEGDEEKCKAWFAAAPQVVQKALLSSKHDAWCKFEEWGAGIVGNLEACGVPIPVEALSQVLHAIHEGIHTRMQQVLEQTPTPPQLPAISPEEDQAAFDIFSKVFGSKPANQEWL